ncbi:D-glycero-beta-D-manno-heptose 1-phosphate adenylyltransferase [Altererythrobacter sp. FM1]|uniref:D-glycero-beta-D-manno-heptose 1-phosphate adenylyltransferase n=1 Tax=Tsuneonella flava TaxID=2055955 RepID=UPI000C803659|nr:D-glycero-beta-D-manno-heptose 1-phosphate adenylyltransferase [Tsuneonella flava]ROT96708.1 D-glycero-beta-D-manno-heptose 1-phosphate adenylyltransferase [Altererythrobacter sp. FM1]
MTGLLTPPDIHRICTAGNARLHEKLTPARMASGGLALPRPLVFTNGVFDILHRGHVTYLAAARALGASLVVGLNSDDSVRRLGKGSDRPINPQVDRALVIAALASVDAVLLFTEDTPCELIARIRPDIYVKGGDYDIDALPETQIVRGWGGQAYALPFADGYSTTALIARTRAAPC